MDKIKKEALDFARCMAISTGEIYCLVPSIDGDRIQYTITSKKRLDYWQKPCTMVGPSGGHVDVEQRTTGG